jgi:hypothetical protein
MSQYNVGLESVSRCLAAVRRGRVLVRAADQGAPQQDDEASRREEARIAALEKLTRSGPEQKKRQQTAVQRAERRASTPVRFSGLPPHPCADARCDSESVQNIVLAQP